MANRKKAGDGKAKAKSGRRKTIPVSPQQLPDHRHAAIEAALALAAHMDWSDITLKAVAGEAGLPLADVVELFADKNAILSAFMATVDRAVIEALDPEIDGEAPRERLLDIFISRLEVLGAHKQAMQNIWKSLSRDPQAMMALAPSVIRSQKAMMAAAGLDASGIAGALRAQGLALVFARGLRVWLADDDPGMARAMATLDRGLRDGEAMLSRLSRLDDVGKVATAFVSAVMKRRREKREEKGDAA